jgi:hypothetical protein
MNPSLLAEMLKQGFVSKRKHSSHDLYILNYTPAAQYDWKWNEVTIQCRGLIVDGKDNIIARPWPKFFTFEQWAEMRNYVHNLFGVKYKNMFEGPFKVYEKVDGSMGVLYNVDGVNYIATRGSFDSDQAKRGTQILHNMGLATTKFDLDKHTYVFEIIYPENRIVVDYGIEEKLVLLSILDTKTGKDVEYVPDCSMFWERAKEYDGIADYTKLAEMERENCEGFVLHFENGIRAKFKFDEYKRLHRVMTGLNEKDIYWALHEGKDLKTEFANVPDEFYAWIESVAKTYRDKYNSIYNHVNAIYTSIYTDKTRNWSKKMIAEKYKDYKYRAILFALVDGKEFKQTIWKQAKQELKNESESNRCDVSN